MALALALAVNRSLEHLNLESNDISPQVVPVLEASLSTNKTLQAVDLASREDSPFFFFCLLVVSHGCVLTVI